MSLGNEHEVEVEDQEIIEVGSGSSCSGHESQSVSSSGDDAGSCSQSDISLCDDGGSDGEAGEGDHILGNLFFDG